MKSQTQQHGFTLVELLVAIVIIGVIANMVVIALSGAQKQSQNTRASALMTRLNLIVMELYEQESLRNTYADPGAIQRYPSPPFVGLPNPNTPAKRSLAISLLNWKRDYLRCAIPDRIEDLKSPPVDVQYTIYSSVASLSNPLTTRATRLDPEPSIVLPPWNTAAYSRSIRWQSISRFQDRAFLLVSRLAAANGTTPPANFNECVDFDPTNGEWTEQHQGAECLYLIMTMNSLNGIPMDDGLRDRDIGDTDEDGVPEILDPWGTPVGFLRWPCGFYLSTDWMSAPSTPVELAARKRELRKDTLDIVYSDPRYTDTTSSDFEQDDPFTVFPVVVSAGSDRVFDMVGLDTPPSPAISYTNSGFPVPPTNVLPFPPTYRFVDPYQYGISPANQLGSLQDTAETRTNNSSDNVYPSFGF